MATKKETIEQTALGQGCLGKAADDEPVFVLRAHDVTAPAAVRYWAGAAAAHGVDRAKRIEAHEVADKMAAWQQANSSKVPD